MESKVDMLTVHGPESHTMSSRDNQKPIQNYSYSQINTGGGDVGSHNQFHEYHYHVSVNIQCGYHGISGAGLREIWTMGKESRCPVAHGFPKETSNHVPESSQGGKPCSTTLPHGSPPIPANNQERNTTSNDHDVLIRSTNFQPPSTTKVLAMNDKPEQPHPAYTAVNNAIEKGVQHTRPCEPYTTLILHLGDCITQGRTDLPSIRDSLLKHVALPAKVVLSRSQLTLFCYLSVPYTGAHLGRLRDTIWRDIHQCIGARATDKWRLKLFNSWPSIVIHQVFIAGSNKLLTLPEIYSRVKSELVRSSGIPGFQADDIKSIRCLSKGEGIPVQGKVSIKVSLGQREDAHHFLKHGTRVFGVLYKTSWYTPRKSRRVKSGLYRHHQSGAVGP